MRWFLLSLALLIGGAQSQDKTPEQQQQRRDGKENAKKEQIGTEKQPVVITVQPTKEDRKEAEARAEERQNKKQSDADLVWWTRVLGILAGLQFVALIGHAVIFRSQAQALRDTIGEMQKATFATEKAAEAALIQANTMVSAERGYAKMSHCNVLNLNVVTTAVQFQMEIKNWGRTPVQITNVCLCAHIRDAADPLPKEPPYGAAQSFYAFLVSQEAVYFSQNVSAGEQTSDVQDGNKTLYLIGYVDYVDKLGTKRRGGYGRQYFPQLPGLGSVSQRATTMIASARRNAPHLENSPCRHSLLK